MAGPLSWGFVKHERGFTSNIEVTELYATHLLTLYPIIKTLVILSQNTLTSKE